MLNTHKNVPERIISMNHKKNHGSISRYTVWTVAGLIAAMLLTSCGSGKDTSGAGGSSGTDVQEPAAVSETSEEANTSTSQAQPSEGSAAADTGSSDILADTSQPAWASKADELLGHWVLAYFNSYYRYSDGDEGNYSAFLSDEYFTETELIIRKDGDRYLADYRCYGYESDSRYYGMPLEYSDVRPYDGYEGNQWCMVMKDPFGEEDSDCLMKITSSEDGFLLVTNETRFEDANSDYQYYSVTENYYLKKDSPRLDNVDDLRYFNTVRVSNVDELLKNMKNNTKVILEAGTYDFSSVTDDKLNSLGNPCIRKEDEEDTYFQVYNLESFRMEAADGAKVLIRTSDPHAPAIFFSNCRYISINGITAGHDVEPGYCSGSVFRLENCNSMKINKCSLFGSGTYGIDASSTYSVTITDTDIYECSNGLLQIYESGNMKFINCTMRDSREYSMINLYSVYDICFDGCTFTGNTVEYDNESFVQQDEYDEPVFKNCVFRNNKYKTFSSRKVTMENCTIDDN